MPNIKSAVKRVNTNEKRRVQNASAKSAMRTAMKNVELAVAAKDAEKATTALTFAAKKLDTAAGKGLVHSNFANRQKSRLAKKVNSMNA